MRTHARTHARDILLSLLLGWSFPAAAVTALTGTILSPGGTPITGTLYLTLSQTVVKNGGGCGSGTVATSPPFVFNLTGGSISGPGAGPYNVVGQDCATPSGFTYHEVVTGPSGAKVIEQDVAITGASVDMGTIGPVSPAPPLPPGTALGGDVTGPISTTTVQKIQNRSVSASAPADTNVLCWNNGGSIWQPCPATLLTTKGDLLSFTTLAARVGVGPDGTVPMADSAQAAGWRWAVVPGTGTVTTLTAGSGITLTPNPIITAGTVAFKPPTGSGYVHVTAGVMDAATIDAIPNGDAPVGISRQVATTAPLTGGGDLSVNRTLGLSITTTNDGGAVVKQAATPGTQQASANFNVSGTGIMGTAFTGTGSSAPVDATMSTVFAAGKNCAGECAILSLFNSHVAADNDTAFISASFNGFSQASGALKFVLESAATALTGISFVTYSGGLAERGRVRADGRFGMGIHSPSNTGHFVSQPTFNTGGVTIEQETVDTVGPNLHFWKGRGSVDTPAQPTSGDSLGFMDWSGYGSGGGSASTLDSRVYVQGAKIEVLSTGTINSTRMPTIMTFSTGTNATPTVVTEAMRIDQNQRVNIGSSTVGVAPLTVGISDANTTWGATTGQYGLRLQNTSGTNNDFNNIVFYGSVTSAAWVAAQVTDNTNSYGNISFATRGATTVGQRLRITQDGHTEFSGVAPGVSTCGGSPSIVGNDNVGKVTIGSAPGTTCTVTFTTTWTNAPACTTSDETSAILTRGTSTTTVLTLAGVFVAGDVVSYMCFGRF